MLPRRGLQLNGLNTCCRLRPVIRPVVRPLSVSRYATQAKQKPFRSTLSTKVAQSSRPQKYITANKPEYPELLLIYRTSTLKTAFIGWFKVASVFLFAFSCLYIAPGFYFNPDAPWWTVPAVIFGGSIPVLIVGTGSAPFVNSIKIRIPPVARRNRESLLRWVQSAPSDTLLEFTTIRLIGLQRTTTVKLGDIRPLPPKLGRLANLEVRSTAGKIERKEWWKRAIALFAEPRNHFYVGGGRQETRQSRAQGVWEMLYEQIRNREMGRGGEIARRVARRN